MFASVKTVNDVLVKWYLGEVEDGEIRAQMMEA
jgi:hypothetical protein